MMYAEIFIAGNFTEPAALDIYALIQTKLDSLS